MSVFSDDIFVTKLYVTNLYVILFLLIFEAAYTDLLNQNSMLYFKNIDGLTTYQLNFLYAVADGVRSEFTRKENLQRYQLGTSANIRRLKTSLENKELIDISGKTVSFNDPVFKLWFKKNVRRF